MVKTVTIKLALATGTAGATTTFEVQVDYRAWRWTTGEA